MPEDSRSLTAPGVVCESTIREPLKVYERKRPCKRAKVLSTRRGMANTMWCSSPNIGAWRCIRACGRSWGRGSAVWRSNGMSGGRGPSAARPCAHAVECAAEVLGVQRDGVHQGHERDPYCASLCRPAKKLRRPAFLGPGFLGVHGRQKRGGRPAVHPKPRKGRQTPRTTGTGGALSASRL